MEISKWIIRDCDSGELYITKQKTYMDLTVHENMCNFFNPTFFKG